MLFVTTAAIDVAEAFGCLLAVDFISGMIHWAEDTWLVPGRSKVLDAYVVRDNIEHHRRPGAIRNGTWWTTNRAGIAGSLVAAGVLALFGVHAWEPWLIVLLSSHANQVHLWAHSAERPRIVRGLQRIGLLQSRRHHGAHHTSPFADHFCAVTNYLNPLLDGVGFWRGLEACVALLGGRVVRATEARGGY